METQYKSDSTLSEDYEFALDKLTLLLDKDPWIAREAGIAMALDDCLLRLKLWGQEIGYENEVLEQVEDEYGDLRSTIQHFLVMVCTSIEEIAAIREDMLEDPTRRVVVPVERLQLAARDLTSHVMPFIALREMTARDGPIYEFRTGMKRSTQPVTSILRAPSMRLQSEMLPIDISELSFKPPSDGSEYTFSPARSVRPLSGAGPPELALANSPPSIEFSAVKENFTLQTPRMDEYKPLPVGVIAPTEELSVDGGRKADTPPPSKSTATGRWRAAVNRVRLWSRTPDIQSLIHYEHSPLSSRGTLRLLRLLPTLFGETIKCEVFQVQPRELLSQTPMTWVGEAFEAVSWLWSREVRDMTMYIFSRSQWRSRKIPRSLNACLNALRLYDKPRIIWIDYLCSNRSDEQELKDLTILFHPIFAAAENVCVWLGESDQDSDLVMDSISKRSAKLTASDSRGKELALLQRRWFSRRWIIQEVAWARRCQVYCGSKVVDWSDFSAWISLLGAHNEFSNRVSNAALTGLHRWHAFRLIEILNLVREAGGNGDSGIYLAMNLVGYRVDYDQPYDEFCKRFIEFSIWSSGSLDIICVPWAPDVDAFSPFHYLQEKGLPSWVSTARRAPVAEYQLPASQNAIQWRRINGDILAELPTSAPGTYMAARGGNFDLNSLKFRKCGTMFSMYVQGFILGDIKVATVASQLGNLPAEWASFVPWTDHSQMPPEEYWKTLVADQSMIGRGAPAHFQPLLRELYSLFPGGFDILAQDMTQAASESSLMAEFVNKLQATIWNRTLARISRDKRLALVPRDAQVGDLICILYGCSVPVVLRKRSKTRTERWEQRESAIREEHAAVYVQRRYREILLRRSSSSPEADRSFQREPKIPRESVWDKVYLAIFLVSASVGFLLLYHSKWVILLTVWFGLLGLRRLPSFFLIRARDWRAEIKSPRSPAQPPRLPFSRSSARPPRPPRPDLNLSMPVEPYCFTLVGECYVHGMMDGDAITLQNEQKIPVETFELV